MGNVAEDLVNGAWVPGGPSLYASRVAFALGADVTLLTGMTPAFDTSVLEGIELQPVAARTLPRYENSYDASGNRAQLLHEIGEPIPTETVARSIAAVGPDVVYLAPAFHELSALPDITFRAASVTGVSVQGPLRDRRGIQVLPQANAFAAAAPLLRSGHWAFLSDEDAGSEAKARAFAGQACDLGANVIVTGGAEGIDVYRPRRATESWHAVPARIQVDPTGAGDTFATAFLLRLAESGDEHLAIRFALVASSLAVERSGVQNIPTRGEIDARAQMAGAA